MADYYTSHGETSVFHMKIDIIQMYYRFGNVLDVRATSTHSKKEEVNI